jgi:hypothetical protein
MALAAKTATVTNDSFVIELLASAIATNGIPTTTAGIGTELLRPLSGKPVPDTIRVGVVSTAGSGTMAVTLRLWGRAGGLWFRLKDLNASSAAPGTAVAIAETSADAIQYSEEVSGIAGCDRLYLEIIAIAGSSTAVTGYAIVGR